jgi:hypothetical protein
MMACISFAAKSSHNGIAASIVGRRHRQWLPGLDQQLHSHSLSPSTMQHCS